MVRIRQHVLCLFCWIFCQRLPCPVRFVLNKMDKATADKISTKIGKEHVVGFVPFTSSIQEKGLSGEELDTTAADITDVTSFILNVMQGGA